MKKVFVVLLVLVMVLVLLPAPAARAAEYTAYEARDSYWPSFIPQIGNHIVVAIFGLNAENNRWELITTTALSVKSVGADTATCTSAGGIVCTATGVYEGHTLSVSHTYATPAKGHSWAWVTDKAPTCVEAGKEHMECTRCGEKNEESRGDRQGQGRHLHKGGADRGKTLQRLRPGAEEAEEGGRQGPSVSKLGARPGREASSGLRPLRPRDRG